MTRQDPAPTSHVPAIPSTHAVHVNQEPPRNCSMNRHFVRRCVAPLMLGLAVSAGTTARAEAQRADTTVISGRVTSEGGVPIPSAIVTVRTLRASTQTNDAGTFRL